MSHQEVFYYKTSSSLLSFIIQWFWSIHLSLFTLCLSLKLELSKIKDDVYDRRPCTVIGTLQYHWPITVQELLGQVFSVICCWDGLILYSHYRMCKMCDNSVNFGLVFMKIGSNVQNLKTFKYTYIMLVFNPEFVNNTWQLMIVDDPPFA